MKIETAMTRTLTASSSLETQDLAEPHNDEILVKLVATGACHGAALNAVKAGAGTWLAVFGGMTVA